jgi:hypothetical protein
MAAYTWDEVTDILLAYGAADGNVRMAQRLYQERLPSRRLPHHSTFASINRRLRETGSLNVNRHDHGRGRTVRTPRLEKAVLNMVADTPSTSTRRVGHAMHASHTTVWQVSSSCTRMIDKKFRQWAQRTTPGNRTLVSGFSNAVL